MQVSIKDKDQKTGQAFTTREEAVAYLVSQAKAAHPEMPDEFLQLLADAMVDEFSVSREEFEAFEKNPRDLN